ncbi:hypothetical protein B0H13DRAFT_2370642 [Mycena leptocephala]|nr:hypothetical protein B0H13DRAFT_2370642 [Mycena leptocephala]
MQKTKAQGHVAKAGAVITHQLLIAPVHIRSLRKVLRLLVCLSAVAMAYDLRDFGITPNTSTTPIHLPSVLSWLMHAPDTSVLSLVTATSVRHIRGGDHAQNLLRRLHLSYLRPDPYTSPRHGRVVSTNGTERQIRMHPDLHVLVWRQAAESALVDDLAPSASPRNPWLHAAAPTVMHEGGSMTERDGP